ncbi:MAG TPA: hypothetical protein PK867_29315 [Pirellulales bacterium]|nr:hypothetical protein [Pirellulales bacterium]
MHAKHNLPSDVMSAIEACRPDSDDASLAEVASILENGPPARVAELRRSVQRVDRAIMAATQKLPVPEGLADRILANLPTSPIGPATYMVGGQASADAVEIAGHGHQPGRQARRRWSMVAGVGLSMAAGLLIALAPWSSRGSVDVAEVQAEARAFYKVDDHGAPLASSELQTSLPGLAANAILGWREVTFLNRDGVAYELSGRRRVQGTLYVVALRSFWGPKLNDLPLMPVPHGTAGVTVAAWADDSNAYVLVVKGGERDFWSLFSRNVAA